MFNSIDEFKKKHRELRETIDPQRKMVTVCGGTGCTAFGSPSVREAFKEEIQKRGLSQKITVRVTGCHGFCEKGPVVVIMP
ncbi:MAG: NADH-quinone oxidoreductase subunit F, partial [Spirochaetes bacterium]